MKNLKNLAGDFVELIDADAAKSLREKELPLVPAFERATQERPMGNHWRMPLPPTLTRAGGSGRFDLCQVLRQCNVSLESGTEEYSCVSNLSTLLWQLRTRISQKPQMCDLEDYYIYGILLNRLSRRFYNCNLSFGSYFDAPLQRYSIQSLLCEYIQVQQLTVLRLYNSFVQRDECEWNGERDGPLLMRCCLLQQALLRCCEHCLSEKFLDQSLGECWFYQHSPQSLGSSSMDSEIQVFNNALLEDKKSLRRFIEKELGGLVQMDHRLQLIQAKCVELDVALLLRLDQEDQSATDTEYGDADPVALLSERSDYMHEKCVPRMIWLAQFYHKFAQQTRATAPGLAQFCDFNALYWELLSYYTLAECEYQCYQERDFGERVPYGKSALKRLEMARASMHGNAAKHILSVVPLESHRRQSFDANCERIESLYALLGAVLRQSYSYNGSDVKLIAVSVYKEDQMKKNGEDFTAFQRSELQKCPRHDIIEKAFKCIEELHTKDRRTEIPVVSSSAQPSEIDRAILEERKRCYEKILSMLRSDGTALIPKEDCNQLLAQLAMMRK